MQTVATLTLNPAVDISTSTERVEPSCKLRCAEPRRDPGGGGINVARVVARLGGKVTAIFPCGGAPGDWLFRQLVEEAVECAVLPIEGETRENFSIFNREAGRQYQFVMPGPVWRPGDWDRCLARLSDVAPVDYLCVSGSLPPGLPISALTELGEQAATRGTRLIVDAGGLELARVLAGRRAFLVKPNLREMAALVGEPLINETAEITACQRLVDRGDTRAVALTRGDRGALLVTKDGAWRAKAPAIRPESTIGAGDSFLGALIWSLTMRMNWADSLRHAVAAGSAALIAPGTELCRRADVMRLAPGVVVEPIAPSAAGRK